MKKTVIYSVLHLLVDGVCALAMLGHFASGSEGAILFLIYNFCAFALQMPMGALMDLLLLRHVPDENYVRSCGYGSDAAVTGNEAKRNKILRGCASAGAVLTLAGALLHPVVLGIGNALFHVGGGMEIIRTDRAEEKDGRLLGIFVAPGALGLFLGAQAAGTENDMAFYIACALVTALLLGMAFHMSGDDTAETANRAARGEVSGNFKSSPAVLAAAGCFLVVILRSYIGLAVNFSWKTTFAYGLVCTLAVVFGKMAGGILAAGFGKEKVVITSLLIAAAGYWFSEIPFAGIMALFFFNMTMPVTLHILTEKFPASSGFVFGLLTFALFLGFLPIGLGIGVPVPAQLTAAAGSGISAAVLLLVLRKGAEERQGG